MNYLRALSSLNPLNVIGNAVETACDALLPPQLEFVGDAAAGITNLVTGNYVGAVEDAVDLMQGLPQQLAGLANQRCQQEPPPPPVSEDRCIRSSATSGFSDAVRTATSRVTERLRTQAAQEAQQAQRLTALTEAMKELVALLRDLVSSLGNGNPAGTATGPAANANTNAATGPAANANTNGATDTGTTTNTHATSTTSTTSERTGLNQDARDFLALADSNPDEFMRRVRAGDIPSSLNTTQGMLALQANLQHISEMNRMMSQILDAMHRMSDGILNNLRV